MTAHPLAAAFPLLTPAQLDQISGLAENVAIEKGLEGSVTSTMNVSCRTS